jgi:TetR/AcrR family transcriptional repressor of nem operon
MGRPRHFDAQEVLSQAMHVFWRQGYEGTALSALEAATGLGRQSLYATFGDKRALFAAAVEHYFSAVIQPGFIDILDNAETGLLGLQQVIHQWESTAKLDEFAGCLMGNTATELGSSDPAMAELLDRKFTMMSAALERAIKRAKAAREVPPGLDAAGTARALLALAQGLAVLAKVNPSPKLVRDVLNSARSLLGIAAR